MIIGIGMCKSKECGVSVTADQRSNDSVNCYQSNYLGSFVLDLGLDSCGFHILDRRCFIQFDQISNKLVIILLIILDLP